MTEWQKSCVEALIISPSAFKLFKEKQKNKKHVDQFINKIWPYKIASIDKELKAGTDVVRAIINGIIEVGKFKSDSKIIQTNIDKHTLLKAFEKSINKKAPPWNEDGVAICIKFREEDGDYEDANLITWSESERIQHSVEYKINRLSGRRIVKIEIFRVGIGHDNREKMSRYFENLMLNFKNQEKEKKSKKAFLGQNVGIEIEYDGTWHKYMERKLTKSVYAVSFNSGIDGGSTDGSNYKNSTRLRENRLRINGHRGLISLHMLLEEMIKSSSKMTNKSGMHYHIDMTRFMNSENRRTVNFHTQVRNLLNNQEFGKPVLEIFDMNASNFGGEIIKLVEQIRNPTEFNTSEWRMGTPTFNFSKITIQILCAIHITNVVYKRRNINAEYLNHLAFLYNKISSNQ